MIFRMTTWGESHGAAIGVVVDGCPAGLELSVEDIQHELDRRKPGVSEITTERKEADVVQILSGVFEGQTLGTPISMLVWNKDVDSRPYEELKHVARPGQADFSYQMKYGLRDYRGGGRASGRETAARVAAGAIAKKILTAYGIQTIGHVVEVGRIRAREVGFEELKKNVERNAVRCADLDAAVRMEQLIKEVKAEGDSVGGVVEIIATGVPAGLGEPVICRIAVKPTSSIAKPQRSVDMAKKQETEIKIKGRHDPCICSRIVPVAEAMVALVLVDCLIVSLMNNFHISKKLEIASVAKRNTTPNSAMKGIQ
jgi:chorismate synthase